MNRWISEHPRTSDWSWLRDVNISFLRAVKGHELHPNAKPASIRQLLFLLLSTLYYHHYSIRSWDDASIGCKTHAFSGWHCWQGPKWRFPGPRCNCRYAIPAVHRAVPQLALIAPSSGSCDKVSKNEIMASFRCHRDMAAWRLEIGLQGEIQTKATATSNNKNNKRNKCSDLQQRQFKHKW